MPNLFARTTPLPDLAGRLDYIANPDRQEHLLAVYDSAEDLLDGQYWQILAQECQAAFAQKGNAVRHIKDKKTGELIEKEVKCREGREIHMLLSNSLLDRMEPEAIAQTLSEAFELATGSPNRVALHFNKTEKSFHAHIILPERRLLQEPEIKIAARNLFFDEDGKRRYRKSDILDANGQLRPGCRICKKGEVYQECYFSSSDRDIKTRAWLKSIKTDVILQLRNGALRGDCEITEYDPTTGKLAQQYIGPKVDAKTKAAIEAGNEMVKEYNALVDAGRITHDEAMRNQEEYNRQDDRNAYLAAKLEEIRLRDQRDLELRKAAAKKMQVYSRPDWVRSSNGLPYRIGKYDEHGRERTLIELIIILAVVTIQNEAKRWETTPTTEIDSQDFVRSTIHAKKDWKVQAMMDTIRIAREEGINNPLEIDERLQEVGKSLSKSRAEARRLAGAKSRMDPLAQAVTDFNRLERHCERILAMADDDLEKQIQMAQNAANLAQYKAAKANTYRAGLFTPESRQDFLGRYKDISRKLDQAEGQAAELKEQYRRLSKLKYNVEIAQNRQYCYDAEYCPRYEDPEQKQQLDGNQGELQQAPEQRKKKITDENNGGFSGER